MRPNCLEKNKQPYMQCTMKAQSCREAWRPNCKARYSLTCYDRFTYCDCQCDLSPNLKPAAGRLPKRW
ncbi:uncharacterized protein LOC142579683 isoform X3 [Dermacentor variabilis]